MILKLDLSLSITQKKSEYLLKRILKPFAFGQREGSKIKPPVHFFFLFFLTFPQQSCNIQGWLGGVLQGDFRDY